MSSNGRTHDGSDDQYEELDQLGQPYYEDDELCSHAVDEQSPTALTQWEAIEEVLQRASRS